MGSDDDMFRIWSGPEGSSHKEPLSGIRIHRAHGLSFCAVLPNRAMLDAARHPGRQFVIQKAGHDQKVNALPFSCQLVRPGCRSLAAPKHRWLHDPDVGNYFGFLMRRVAVVVIPSPARAIPASAIALGVVSPVFASLSAVVSACLPLPVFACLEELGAVSLPVAGEPAGCVVSVGCAEPEGGVVSVGCVISGEAALSAAAFASSYALQASS